MIIEKIIDYVCLYFNIDRKRINPIIENVKVNGYLQAQDVREFANLGLPIISTISGILKISDRQSFELIRYDKDKHTGKITYQDLIIILEIISQDFILNRNTE